jgi:hypothetical protein
MVYFGRQFLVDENPYLPLIFYLTCSNVLLIPLFLDQVLYPLLFMLCLLFLWQTLKRQSFIFSIITGALIYTAMYFTFSMLPVIFLAILWVVIETLRNRENWNLAKTAKALIGLAVGIILLYIILRVILNYDFFTRYTHAFSRHIAIKVYNPSLKNLLETILVNNIDIAAWTGFSIFLLFIVRVIKAVIAFLQKKATRLDELTAVFVLTYGGLNVMGQTRGEVGRIWLFLVPLLTLFAAAEAVNLFKKKDYGIYLIIGIQLTTVFLTFKFQDFFA